MKQWVSDLMAYVEELAVRGWSNGLAEREKERETERDRERERERERETGRAGPT